MSETQGTGINYSAPGIYGSGCQGILDGVRTNCNTILAGAANGNYSIKFYTPIGGYTPFTQDKHGNLEPLFAPTGPSQRSGNSVAGFDDDGELPGTTVSSGADQFWPYSAATLVNAVGGAGQDNYPLPALNLGLGFLLATGGCDQFVQALIDRVATNTGIPAITNKVTNLTKGVKVDFSQQHAGNGRRVAGRAYERDASGSARLGISPRSAPGRENAYDRRLATWQYVESYLHELTHLASSGRNYTDQQLARAAAELSDQATRDAFGKVDDGDVIGNSRFYDRVLQNNCIGPAGRRPFQ
jgi:hypothetical protein